MKGPQFRWILEATRPDGTVEYVSKAEFDGHIRIEYSDSMDQALRYPIERRAYEDCEYFNRKNIREKKQGGRTFRVIDLGESA